MKTFAQKWKVKLPTFAPRGWQPDPERHIARLPGSFTIGGVKHVAIWRAAHGIVLENYSASGTASVFRVFRVEQIHHAEGDIEEVLGDLLGTFSDLTPAAALAVQL